MLYRVRRGSRVLYSARINDKATDDLTANSVPDVKGLFHWGLDRDVAVQRIKRFFTSKHKALVMHRIHNTLQRFEKVRAFLKQQIMKRKKRVSRIVRLWKSSSPAFMGLTDKHRKVVVAEMYHQALEKWRNSQRRFWRLLAAAMQHYNDLMHFDQAILMANSDDETVFLVDPISTIHGSCLKFFILLLHGVLKPFVFDPQIAELEDSSAAILATIGPQATKQRKSMKRASATTTLTNSARVASFRRALTIDVPLMAPRGRQSASQIQAISPSSSPTCPVSSASPTSPASPGLTASPISPAVSAATSYPASPVSPASPSLFLNRFPVNATLNINSTINADEKVKARSRVRNNFFKSTRCSPSEPLIKSSPELNIRANEKLAKPRSKTHNRFFEAGSHRPQRRGGVQLTLP